MGRADHSASYRAIIAAISDDALHTLPELVAADVVDHNPQPGQPEGLAGFTYWARSARGAFSDLSGTVEDLLADGDRVAGRVTWHGTHSGDFLGVPATGSTVRFSAFHLVRFSSGLAAEWWGVADLLTALDQVGARD